MRTRIIQDDPQENDQAESDAGMSGAEKPMPVKGVAVRMARWSAHHRKKAVFGWLALAVALFAISIVSPSKEDRVRDIRPRRVGPGRDDSLQRLQTAGRRERAGPERIAQRRRTRVQGCRTVCHLRDLRARRGREGRVAVRSRKRRPDLGRQALGSDPARVPWPVGRGDRQGRSGRRPPRRDTDGESRLLRRVVRREHGEGDRRRVLRRPEEGWALLASADARHPPTRLRRARRRRHPAPAGPHRSAGDARPRCTHQPGAPDVGLGARHRSPDRARRRGRLHDVLLETGARRACGWSQRRGRARGGSGHVRSFRPDLGLHGAGRHGGDVPDRRRRVRIVRRCDDDRRRDGDARVADGAPRVALEAGGRRRPRSRPGRPPAPPERRRGACLGSDRRPRAPASGAVGRGGRRPPDRTRDPGVPAAYGSGQHRLVPAEVPDQLQPRQSGVPRRRDRGGRRRQGTERRDASESKTQSARSGDGRWRLAS